MIQDDEALGKKALNAWNQATASDRKCRNDFPGKLGQQPDGWGYRGVCCGG